MSRPAFTPLSQEFKDRETFAHVFLSALYPYNAPGFIEFRAKCNRGYISQQWYSREALPNLAQYLRNHDDCSIWFGTATREAKGSGAAHNCLAAYSLHVDADCKTPERAQGFKAALDAFPLRPSIVATTGSPHSYHVYWKLAHPLPLADVKSSSLYKRTLSGLARHFDSDHSVADVARVMRLPGSRNMKPEARRALVQLTLLKPERAYSFEAFTPFADAKDEQAPRPASPGIGHSNDVDLVAEFTERGWMVEDQGDAFYYVRCPWKHEHSADSGKSETALWQYGPLWCFRCMHSHCAGRRVAQVYEYFRLMAAAEAMGVAK